MGVAREVRGAGGRGAANMPEGRLAGGPAVSRGGGGASAAPGNRGAE